MGQGPKVVLELVNKSKLLLGSRIYFDNLFMSFPLLEDLSNLQIGGTGTVRQNRLNKVDIITKKDLEKKSVDRGMSHVLYKDDQVFVAWKDNKAVYALRRDRQVLQVVLLHHQEAHSVTHPEHGWRLQF